MGNSEDYVRRKLELAENVRRACVEAAIDGYERAAMSGLCHEGAWDAAISAMRMVVETVFTAFGDGADPVEDQPVLQARGRLMPAILQVCCT